MMTFFSRLQRNQRTGEGEMVDSTRWRIYLDGKDSHCTVRAENEGEAIERARGVWPRYVWAGREITVVEAGEEDRRED